MSIVSWSTTAADNDDAASGINWMEGQLPATVNNSARGMMKDIADWRDAIGGAKTTAGAANAYTLTTGLGLAALVNGFLFGFEASFTNSGAATIAVDGLTAKAIRRSDGTALVAGDIVSGGIYLASYESGADRVILINPMVGNLGNYQPIDSDLTAIAALASTGFISRTGTGTMAVRTVTAGTGIGVSNGDGVSGGPVISVDTTSAFTPTWSGLHTFSAKITTTGATVAGNTKSLAFHTATYTIADNAVQIHPIDGTVTGLCLISTDANGGSANPHGLFRFRVGATPNCVNISMAVATLVTFTTGSLSGTTGADGDFTISAHSSNGLYFENRSGAQKVITVTILSTYAL